MKEFSPLFNSDISCYHLKMLCFQIIKSNDESMPNQLLSHFDKFIIGSSKRADIIIKDHSVSPLHISLEVKKDSIVCRSFLKGTVFLINKKKYSGAKVIKVNDIISLGETQIQILNFQKITQKKEVSLEVSYKQSTQKLKGLKKILFCLEQELLTIKRPPRV